SSRAFPAWTSRTTGAFGRLGTPAMAEAWPASGLRCRAGEVNRTGQVLVSGAILREVGFRTIVGPGLIGRHTADNGKAEQRHHHARTKKRERPHLTNSW